jgi:type II secretory pathway pseudopilin PulG
MRRVIAIGIILVLPLLLLPSCAAGEISQEEYDKIVNDLAAIQTQIQSLQDDFNEAQALIQSLQGESAKVQPPTQPLPEEKGVTEEKPAEALAYAEYMDVLMYQLWKDSELTPRFDFADDTEWMMELRSRTSEMGDAELTNYATELEERREFAMEQLWFYCLDRIEKALK